ncbi:hypothetical protein GF362_04475 [Candidatus Dojkabacteria bacterium]|nr:hypothetical protein [Candidatus Dojkabacteria bacterium]
MTQDPNQTSAVDDDAKKSEEQGGKSASVGGPEGQPISVERSPQAQAEVGEVLKQIESTAEKQAEAIVQKEKKAQKKASKKQKVKAKRKSKKIEGPKVYGYKIPSKISNNLHRISKMKGKGDPKTGLACLYVFLDRLLRMNRS